MTLYRFKAVDKTGKSTDVVLDGDTREEALGKLRARSLMPLHCYGEVSSVNRHFALSRKGDFDVYAFTNKLAPLLKANIRLERALAILSSSKGNVVANTVVLDLRKGLHEGKKFSALVRSQGPRFPKLYSNLLEVGEETGCMADVVSELKRFLNETKEQREFLITSSIYPAVILGVTLLVMIMMFGVFLPRFSQIFLDMGKELPLPTAIMLEIGNGFVRYGWVVALLLIGGVIQLRRFRKTSRGKQKSDAILLKMPILGKVLRDIDICRFLRTLSILFNNHVPLLDSIRIGIRVIGNAAVAESFSGVDGKLRGGKRLSEALKESPFLSSELIQMLEVGEESGHPGEMLSAAADELQDTIRNGIKRLLALFEPAVIVLLAGVIALVVLSIFLAVMDMNQGTI